MAEYIELGELQKNLLAGQPRALAKAISLAESIKEEHRRIFEKLLSKLFAQPEIKERLNASYRLGLSGPPGVGKSTTIEYLGMHLLSEHKDNKVAVLPVDPTSPVSGGSILGDKTRMTQLAAHPRAFIRPSASGTQKGGVARVTREAILLCALAGYNWVIVETVGVGQAEFEVATMVDVLLLLELPQSGDELQGLKKGISELSDIIAVTKTLVPGLEKAAQHKIQALKQAHSLASSDRKKSALVIGISVLEDKNTVKQLFGYIKQVFEQKIKSGLLQKQRQKQKIDWFEDELGMQLKEIFHKRPDLQTLYEQALQKVMNDDQPASLVVKELFSSMFER